MKTPIPEACKEDFVFGSLTQKGTQSGFFLRWVPRGKGRFEFWTCSSGKISSHGRGAVPGSFKDCFDAQRTLVRDNFSVQERVNLAIMLVEARLAERYFHERREAKNNRRNARNNNGRPHYKNSCKHRPTY